jgi:hypothetical protein
VAVRHVRCSGSGADTGTSGEVVGRSVIGTCSRFKMTLRGVLHSPLFVVLSSHGNRSRTEDIPVDIEIDRQPELKSSDALLPARPTVD